MVDEKKQEDEDVRAIQANGDIVGFQRLEDGGMLIQILVKPIPYPKPPANDAKEEVKKLYDNERNRVYTYNMISLRGFRNDAVTIIQEVL